MKRVSKNLIVADFEKNEVGFIVPHSLAFEAKSFGIDGYLTGALGITEDHKEYIYLWFSSGEICLVDGIALKLLSQHITDGFTIN
jgi:hypothetical protein